MSWEEDNEIISTEEYINRLKMFQQYNPTAVNTFKSTRRAARRGHLMKSGMIVPNRPFHNRRNTCKRKGKSSRTDNDLKRLMWQDVKSAAKEVMKEHQLENED